MTTLFASTLLSLGQSCGGSMPTIAETAAADGRFQTLVAAVDAAGLTETLNGSGQFTVFAPTDAAFAKLPRGTVETLLKPENKTALKNVLLYHVVPGNLMARDVLAKSGWTTANGQRIDISSCDAGAKADASKIVITDIKTSNGTIHVIDTVMLPAKMNIPETATKTGQFATLLAAAEAAGLVEALSAKGPLTVFAPTDEAFAKLPAGTVESLLKPENKDKLAAILTYHVVPGRVYSDDAIKAGTAKTLQGNPASFKSNRDGVHVNNARVVMADIDASNGVIHVIDSVMLPPASAAAASTAKNSSGS
ncbi:MAG: fasciclin domain-containing protein [Phycisphaerales bacterium]|nr:fasciclin domain-containing protein [Phycisphaerales bacterium]